MGIGKTTLNINLCEKICRLTIVILIFKIAFLISVIDGLPLIPYAKMTELVIGTKAG